MDIEGDPGEWPEEIAHNIGDISNISNSEQRRQYEQTYLDSDEDPQFQPSEEDSSEADISDDGNQFIDDDAVLSRVNRRERGLRKSDNVGGKGIKRGPRKPVEPSLEFKQLHSEATSAFIDADFERAVVLVKQAIHLNPEIFAAHSLLSEIFLSQGQKEKALAALFSGAHTRPRDPGVWFKVAKLILDRAGEDRAASLQDVLYCYSRIIEIDHTNYDVRFQRAELYRELGHKGRAAQDYERLLKDLPHNIKALRYLAETYIELNEIEKAKLIYEDSISYYSGLELEEVVDFDWSDVNIYVELFSYENNYEEGILALSELARWLLGRRDDTEWDTIREDDREWDAEDSPRRTGTPWFTPGQYPLESYGIGLPLELRIKLGLYRLKMGIAYKDEALIHFEWLEPENNSQGAKLFDYGDLFREVADALREAGLHEDALRFYAPLQLTQDFADTGLFMAMANCYDTCGNEEEAEQCYLTVAEYDNTNIEARAKLAKFYEKMGMAEQALKYVTEAVDIERQESMPIRKRRFGSRIEQLAKEFRSTDSELQPGDDDLFPSEEERISPTYQEDEPVRFTTSTAATLQRERKAAEKLLSAAPDGKNIRYLYNKLLELQPFMRAGQEDATEDWLDIADALLRDFRSNRVFFPLQRRSVFLGYSREAQRKAGGLRTKTIMDEVQEIAGRIQATLGTPDVDPSSIPTDYQGISFDDWLDVFLEFALVLSGQNQGEEAYDALATAADASIWYHSKPKTCQIYICWFTCALRLKDEEALANVARWFMKEYQFVTDTYRLFATLSRVCGDPKGSLFHSSPSMKFMLRQVKAIDYSLPVDPAITFKRPRESVFQERASLTTKDSSGQSVPAEEMDLALLVLYGHILYAGNSFTNALNYFFRAYALDPYNPAVLLSIGLSYIHHSLKRQSDNRHYLVMEGLSFMHEYRRVREDTLVLQEKQEVEFNFARAWQMLGLGHLAEQAYNRCLKIGEDIEFERERLQQYKESTAAECDDAQQHSQVWVEDFSRQAAYALQCIYSLSGENEMAKKITQRWLVI